MNNHHQLSLYHRVLELIFFVILDLSGIKSQANIPNLGIGAPISANRGASGIDGVLSTAAGFADGLGRGTTLVVGDLSFIHDSNGLTLLKNGRLIFNAFG